MSSKELKALRSASERKKINLILFYAQLAFYPPSWWMANKKYCKLPPMLAFLSTRAAAKDFRLLSQSKHRAIYEKWLNFLTLNERARVFAFWIRMMMKEKKKKLQIDFPFYPVDDALVFAQTSLASAKSREIRKRKKMFNSRARALKMVEHKESNENGFFLSCSLSLATSTQQHSSATAEEEKLLKNRFSCCLFMLAHASLVCSRFASLREFEKFPAQQNNTWMDCFTMRIVLLMEKWKSKCFQPFF